MKDYIKSHVLFLVQQAFIKIFKATVIAGGLDYTSNVFSHAVFKKKSAPYDSMISVFALKIKSIVNGGHYIFGIEIVLAVSSGHGVDYKFFSIDSGTDGSYHFSDIHFPVSAL